jgi:prolyl 4-hydroxylase
MLLDEIVPSPTSREFRPVKAPKHMRNVLYTLVVFLFLCIVFTTVKRLTNKQVNLPTASVIDSIVSTNENPLHTQMEVLSWSPRVFLYKKFLSFEECDKLIEIGSKNLERSEVMDSNKPVSKDRTSYGAWISRKDSEYIDKRIAAVTHYPVDHGEDLYLLNYKKTQQYKPHYDWFGDEVEEGREVRKHGERVATMIIYLSQVEEGGETWFPKIKLKVKPSKGDALLFYDVLPDNSVDYMSEHAGRPVITGEKWIVTRWIRDKKFY